MRNVASGDPAVDSCCKLDTERMAPWPIDSGSIARIWSRPGSRGEGTVPGALGTKDLTDHSQGLHQAPALGADILAFKVVEPIGCA